MRQVLGPGALGRPRGIGWRGRWEGGSGWGIQKKKKKERNVTVLVPSPSRIILSKI